jgi:hypothetical protein
MNRAEHLAAVNRAKQQAVAERLMTGMKTCRGCSVLLPLSSFWKNASRADGHECRCAPCQRLWQAERDPLGVARAAAWRRAREDRKLRAEMTVMIREARAPRRRQRELAAEAAHAAIIQAARYRPAAPPPELCVACSGELGGHDRACPMRSRQLPAV